MNTRSFFRIIAISTLIVIFCSCSKSGTKNSQTVPENPEPPATSIPSANYDITQLSYCIFFEQEPKIMEMQRQDYNELSGVAASVINPGILYMHDDNKNVPIVIADAAGKDLGKIILDGVSTLNPEDISTGPGPEAGKSYIYYADIGDNNNTRSNVVVYRFEEPKLINPTSQTEIHVNPDKIVLKYPSYSYNAETVLVDPITKDVFIATKEQNRSTLYKAAYPQSMTTTSTLEPVLKAPFDLLTAGDISADGKEILLRNKGQIWYWQRTDNKSIDEVLLKAPLIAPYAGNEHQGEGICFAADGSGYYTNSEIRDYPAAISNITFYKRK